MFTTFLLVAQATAFTVAAFPASATNPATATPVAPPVTYPLAQVVCNQPKVSETTPIVNPYEGRIDDPSNPTTRDCALPIEPQFIALPVGSGFKAAYRAVSGTSTSAWSAFSTPFAVTAQTHACDGAAPTTGTVPAGISTRSWCWNGLDVNGNPTVITSWTATVDGTRVLLGNVVVGATANAQGRRLYSAPMTLTAGTRVVRVAGTNAIGEAVFSQSYTMTVTPVLGPPSVADIRGIQ